MDAHSLSETLTWYDAHHPDGVGLAGLQRPDQPDSAPEQAAEHQIDVGGCASPGAGEGQHREHRRVEG